jgi:chaperone LolA
MSFIILPLLLIFPPVHAYGGKLLQSVRDSFKEINSLSGEFTQTTSVRSMDEKFQYSGVFYLLKPEMLRWDYVVGSTDQAYLNGEEMILFQPAQRQAFLLKTGNTASGRSPLGLLLEMDDIEKYYKVSEEKDRLVLHPKTPSIVSQAEMVIREGRFPISEIVLTDSSGNRTTIRIEKIKINPPLKPDKFRFSPPEGVSVIDRR